MGGVAPSLSDAGRYQPLHARVHYPQPVDCVHGPSPGGVKPTHDAKLVGVAYSVAYHPLPRCGGMASQCTFQSSISAGVDHTCAVVEDSSPSDGLDRGVKCWGKNGNGQLGHNSTTTAGDGEVGSTTMQHLPISTASLIGFDSTMHVAAGQTHTCALSFSGRIRCWGDGSNGKLGQGSEDSYGNGTSSSFAMSQLQDVGLVNDDDTIPAAIAIAVGVGTEHTCALLRPGDVQCWGRNWQGQLGLTIPLTPVTFPSRANLGTGRTAIALSVGSFHTCVILDTGDVKCWGQGASGKLGYDSPATIGDDEGEMAGLSTVNLGTDRTATAIC